MSYRPLPPMMPISTVHGSVLPALLQFDQHAVGAGGMDERDERALGALARLLVNQPDAARLQRASAAWMSSTRSVMWWMPGPRFSMNFAMGESGAVGFEQFEGRLAHRA